MGHVLSFSSYLFQDGVIMCNAALAACACAPVVRGWVAGTVRVFC